MNPSDSPREDPPESPREDPPESPRENPESPRENSSKENPSKENPDFRELVERRKLHRTYGRNKTPRIQITYLLAVLIWFMIVVCFQLYETDIYGLLILAIPLVIFFINFINAPYLTLNVENSIYGFNYISVGLLVIVPLITLTRTHYKGNRNKVIMVTVLALVFAVLSVLNIWVRPKWLSIVRHFRSILQTYSLTLIIYALYIYYRGSISPIGGPFQIRNTLIVTNRGPGRGPGREIPGLVVDNGSWPGESAETFGQEPEDEGNFF